MTLTGDSLRKLLDTLKDEKRSIEQQTTMLLRLFPRPDTFQTGWAIYTLLRSRLLEHTQRVYGLHFLFELYRTDIIANNPFLPAFLDEIESPDTEPALKFFSASLVSNHLTLKDMLKKSARDFLNAFEKSPKPIPAVDVEAMKDEFSKKNQTTFSSDFKINAITPPQIIDLHHSPSGQSQATLDDISHQGFELPYCRPPPPILEPSANEFVWLIPDEPREVMWDFSMAADQQTTSYFREMLHKATTKVLLKEETEQLTAFLNANEKFIFQCDLTPDKLPPLIEMNNEIALAVLLKLIHSPQIRDFFVVLTKIPLSLHSMEVVNGLAMAVDLPREFIHNYITNCIDSCRGITPKDNQQRFIRLVSVFVQWLLRNHILSLEDISYQVKTFCLEFPHVKEAAELFRTITNSE
eukprot:TRINITY_DN1996_c0_g1_i1.p1 TRINITY_DN1996_c0_g1~~TRINITY_DN1996_c0_g1_i1.p1  ORF type:complete len:409 (+),score=186.27 TRINITY_DN1996_c0_g1_i1:234-1460(+)